MDGMNHPGGFSAPRHPNCNDHNDQYLLSALVQQHQHHIHGSNDHKIVIGEGFDINRHHHQSLASNFPLQTAVPTLPADHAYAAHEAMRDHLAQPPRNVHSVCRNPIGVASGIHGGAVSSALYNSGNGPLYACSVPACAQSSRPSVTTRSSSSGILLGDAMIHDGRGGDCSVTPAAPPSRYESQKRRDWNTFGQYLRNCRPPLTLARCNGDHVLQFLRHLDQFGKTKVHTQICAYFGIPHPPGPCACPLRQAWGSLDALIGRLRAAFEENGGKPESNPFGARSVRLYLREVRELQAKARGIAYEKKKRKRPKALMGSSSSLVNSSSMPHSQAAPPTVSSSSSSSSCIGTSNLAIFGCN
ncbi:hypothetical protein KP509_02G086500 [Ceratopteris richardii]|uniref:ALOG domain-containing protein n=1 Tax=Ceratopteris richardii TaxID=49495 RepID=A0A8T2VFZ9_CERRI|nr:hypothetical protein KP509_02G086500 [Ceratopteris richardii]